MEGKHSLKHVFNNGGKSQMTIDEFTDFCKYIKEHNGIIDQSYCEITEKIDGSSQFFGIDKDGFFWQKFMVEEKMRDVEQVFRKYKEFFTQIKDNKELWDYMDSLRDSEDDEVKFQFEVVLNAATSDWNDDSITRIVCVPYKRELMGKNGMAFVIQVLKNLKTIDNESEVKKNIAKILNGDLYVSDPEVYDYEPIDIKNTIDDYLKYYDEVLSQVDDLPELLKSRKKIDKEAKDRIKQTQNEYQSDLQDEIAEHFPKGRHGDYYEGLVLKFDNGMMCKITSQAFKELFRQHNAANLARWQAKKKAQAESKGE